MMFVPPHDIHGGSGYQNCQSIDNPLSNEVTTSITTQEGSVHKKESLVVIYEHHRDNLKSRIIL